jgi:Predicted membrane protein
MKRFLKGIAVGIGGIAPGLSGSVMLVIFGLYEKTVEAIGTIFKRLKKNIIFLVPLFAGFGVGILLFSKVVDYLLKHYEIYTRFAFFGLVLGTIPLFYKEVKKKDFKNKNYFLILGAFLLGILLFTFNDNLFPTVTNPNFIQSMILGIAVACSTIIPGVDSATILSAFGLYELYVESVASFNLNVLIPAGVGLGVGALVVSYFINKLIKKHYSLTFSVIFGLFLSIIPSVLNEKCVLAFDFKSLIAIIFCIIGFVASYFFGKLKKDDV